MFRQKPRGTELRQFGLFADCSEAELAAIDSLSTRLYVSTGRVLLREGDSDRQFMFITDGRVGVSRHGGSPIAMLSAGSFVGEMSMLTGERRSATVTALTSVEVLVCNSREFGALLEAAPSVRDKLVAEAASRMAANAETRAA